MDVMRTICSVMGTLEQENADNDAIQISKRLVAIYGPALLYWHHFHNSHKEIEAFTGPTDTVAENFMKLLLQKKEVDPLVIKCFDVSLILYAEHDFNASTFTARTTCSTNSDIYSGFTSGIGALSGNLHGGANEAAMEFIAQFSTADQAEKKLREMFA
jgi:2-methylcitrate synthase